MGRSKSTEEQIAFSLKQAKLETTVADMYPNIRSVRDEVFQLDEIWWLGEAELGRVKQLEEENTRMKRVVADLGLDKLMPQEIIQNSSEAGLQTRVGEFSNCSPPGPCQSERV